MQSVRVSPIHFTRVRLRVWVMCVSPIHSTAGLTTVARTGRLLEGEDPRRRLAQRVLRQHALRDGARQLRVRSAVVAHARAPSVCVRDLARRAAGRWPPGVARAVPAALEVDVDAGTHRNRGGGGAVRSHARVHQAADVVAVGQNRPCKAQLSWGVIGCVEGEVNVGVESSARSEVAHTSKHSAQQSLTCMTRHAERRVVPYLGQRQRVRN